MVRSLRGAGGGSKEVIKLAAAWEQKDRPRFVSCAKYLGCLVLVRGPPMTEVRGTWFPDGSEAQEHVGIGAAKELEKALQGVGCPGGLLAGWGAVSTNRLPG